MYENETINTLNTLGIGRRFSGFTAVYDAVQLALDNEDRLISFYTQILTVLEKRYDRKARNIERNMRTICLHAWQTNPDYLSFLAGYPMSRQPSVVEFIDILSSSIARHRLTPPQS